MPDLVPTLAVLAAFAEGETVITGVAHLRHKESDRLAAVATELGKMGVDGPERPRTACVIRGRGRPTAPSIDTYQDHRIAMSFAVAGLNDSRASSSGTRTAWPNLSRTSGSILRNFPPDD